MSIRVIRTAALAVALTGCAAINSQKEKGAVIGAATGAAVGGVIGNEVSKKR